MDTPARATSMAQQKTGWPRMAMEVPFIWTNKPDRRMSVSRGAMAPDCSDVFDLTVVPSRARAAPIMDSTGC